MTVFGLDLYSGNTLLIIAATAAVMGVAFIASAFVAAGRNPEPAVESMLRQIQDFTPAPVREEFIAEIVDSPAALRQLALSGTR